MVSNAAVVPGADHPHEGLVGLVLEEPAGVSTGEIDGYDVNGHGTNLSQGC